MKCLIDIIIVLILFTIQIYSTPIQFNLHKRFPQSQFSKKCEEALVNYYECSVDLVDFNLVALDIVCAYFNTIKCQSFINKGVNSIPECKNENANLIELNNKYLRHNYFTNNFYCAKIENTNRYCPIIEWICEKSSDVDDNKTYVNLHYNIAIQDTCKSNVCYNAIMNYSKELEDFENGLKKHNNITVDSTIIKRNKNSNNSYKINPGELFKEAVTSLPKECSDNNINSNLNDDNKTINKNVTEASHASPIYHNLIYIIIPILLTILIEI